MVGGRPALIRSDIDWSAFNCRKEWLKTKLGIGAGGRITITLT